MQLEATKRPLSSLLVVIGVREGSQKVVARDARACGQKTTDTSRCIPGSLTVERRLQRAEFLIVDGAPQLDKAIAAVSGRDTDPGACTIQQNAGTFSRTRQSAFVDEITTDYRRYDLSGDA